MHQPDDPPYIEADNQADDPPARWITFTELAKARGISKLSAAALVRRHGWRRQRDNRGHVIALVPLDGPELRREADNQPHHGADDPPHTAAFDRALDAIEAAHAGEIARANDRVTAAEAALTLIEAAHASEVAALRERADTSEQGRLAAQALADAALGNIADMGSRVERAEAATIEERSRADGLRERLDGAERELAMARHDSMAAQQAAAELRLADEARRARGLVARLRDAWRGE
jgi:hypothetical protein